jgi:NAD(P)-dependent dehydrogenase (short-subunit alcohol dehydrogenase family)
MDQNPRTAHPQPPLPEQQQQPPGHEGEMNPKPDHGEQSYKGSGKLTGRAAIITGADSGIGRAVAIAFAREGADVLISYLSEDKDAEETAHWVREAGRRPVLMPGDISNPGHCREIVQQALAEFGRLDILVNNAAHQASFDKLEDIPDDEFERTYRTNLFPQFWLAKAAVPHMKPGATIVNTTSINAKSPSKQLLAYATSKGAILNLTVGLSELLAEKGIRVNAVAPGPVWTPLIPSTMPGQKVENFGKSVPLGRPAQPAELAPAYVYLASDDSTYVTGAFIPVTGGKPML